jgi:predicted PurR-regulated permease PerM
VRDAGFRRAIAVLVIIILLALAWRLANLLLLGFAGLLLGVLLRHLALVVARLTPLGPRLSLALVVVALVGGLVAAGMAFGPRLSAEIAELAALLPQSVAALQDRLGEQPWAEVLIERSPEAVVGGDWSVLGAIGGTLSVVTGAAANLVILIFVGLFLAADPQLYRAGVLHLVPFDRRPRAVEVMDAIGRGLWLWLQAQFIDMLVVAALTGLGLWLLGVPLAITLALIAGVTNIIPYLGPFLSGIPAVLIAFTLGVNEALLTALLFLAVQQFDGHVLMPLIQKRTTTLPPVLTLLAVVGFGLLFGFLGALVATPLILVGMILVQMLYVEDCLGDDSLSETGAQAP